MSRTRMIYCLGGESLNDVPKAERYKAPPIQIIPDEPSDEPFYPDAPGPAPAKPSLPRYLLKQLNKRANRVAVANEPDPNESIEPVAGPSRVSKRAKKAPNRLIEE